MQDEEPAVAILPHRIRMGLWPARTPLDRLLWPLGRPERLRGAARTLADLGPLDHLAGFPRETGILWPGRGAQALISVIMCEPEAIHRDKQARVARVCHRFHRVLSHNEALLGRLPNGIFFPHGRTWVPDWRDRDMTKRAMCSLIASGKRSQTGHRLRHALAERVRRDGPQVDVMGRGYRPFAVKADGLAPYRYSLVIENVRERNYFTEKLVDAVLCRTVPIYWGCPNIADFLDTSGMILCETEEDMRRALSVMSEEDYAARLPGLLAAVPAAAHYADFHVRAAQALLADAPLPRTGQPNPTKAPQVVRAVPPQ
jgi:hypothetical protein